jgi:hypothetical protein
MTVQVVVVDKDEDVERCGRFMVNELNIPEISNERVEIFLIL